MDNLPRSRWAQCPGTFAAGKHVLHVHANYKTTVACWIGNPAYGATAKLSVREIQ